MSKIEVKTNNFGDGKFGVYVSDEEKVVGSVFVDQNESDNNFGPLQVNPPYRRRGIASVLLREMEKLIDGRPIAPFRPDPGMEDEDKRFYSKHGYVIKNGMVFKE